MHLAESRPGGDSGAESDRDHGVGAVLGVDGLVVDQTPPSPRYRKCKVLPALTVTAALRVWFARFRSGWVCGFQSLKFPTTETAPPGSWTGSANVMRTVPSRPGFDVLIT